MRKEMGLGGITDVTLAEARELADIARKMVRSGKNPIIERKLGNRTVADTPTFRVFADAYVKSIESQWKNAKHRAQWKMTLEVYAAPLHDKLLCDIDTNDIHHVLTRDNLWNTKSETASRLRGRIETILDAARVKGYRKGENPARWEGHLEHLLGKRKKLTRGHFASMPYEELPDFISDLRTRTAKVARALEFHILCASRPGMVEQMLMTDVNFDERVWTIPKERMKLERDHMVPLSQRAIDILLEMKKTMRNNVVFYGQNPGEPISNNALRALMKRMEKGHYTPHGFRSSFQDWAGDETEHEEKTTEFALAHSVGDDTKKAYRRRQALRKRRGLMDDWARYLNGENVRPDSKAA